MQDTKPLSEKESLELITSMINKAKEAYYDTGISAIMWGIVITVCSLVRLSEMHFDYRLPFNIYWLTLIAVIPQILIVIKEKKDRKAISYDEFYMDYVWLGFGICIFLMSHVVNVISADLRTTAEIYKTALGEPMKFHFYEFVTPLFLILYGLPTFITGTACRFKPMLWGGIFCWVCCIITLYTTAKVDLLLTAASALVAWFIPGLIIQREYKIYKKEQAKLNV
jgi:hypothetical protein